MNLHRVLPLFAGLSRPGQGKPTQTSQARPKPPNFKAGNTHERKIRQSLSPRYCTAASSSCSNAAARTAQVSVHYGYSQTNFLGPWMQNGTPNAKAKPIHFSRTHTATTLWRRVRRATRTLYGQQTPKETSIRQWHTLYKLTMHNKQRYETSRLLRSGASADWDVYAQWRLAQKIEQPFIPKPSCAARL